MRRPSRLPGLRWLGLAGLVLLPALGGCGRVSSLQSQLAETEKLHRDEQRAFDELDVARRHEEQVKKTLPAPIPSEESLRRMEKDVESLAAGLREKQQTLEALRTRADEAERDLHTYLHHHATP